MKFADVQENFQLYLLDRRGNNLKLERVNVTSKSLPRFNDPSPNYGIAQYHNYLNPKPNPERVIDIEVMIGDQRAIFKNVPENQEIFAIPDGTISTSEDLIQKEVDGILNSSKFHVAHIDKYKANIKSCEEIKMQLNPIYAESKEKDRKLESMQSEIAELKEMVKTLTQQGNSENRSKTTKNQ